jgi:hypothetical protein
MDPRAEYMALVLEKLGTPLLAAVHEVGNRQAVMGANAPTPREDAERMAALLSLITKAGVDLSARLDLKADEDTADGLRVAVTALVSPLVASVYQMTGRIPGDAEIERLQSGFETVLAYADNFSGAADIRDRLQGLEREWAPSDAAQVSLQYFQILVPVVSAVLAFPFGQPEKKLLNDLTTRLLRDAKALKAELFPTLDGTAGTKIELSFLRAASMLYSQCHYAEMARLMSMGDKARDVPLSPDTVIASYEARLAMLSELGKTLIMGAEDDTATGGASSQAPAAPQQEQAPPPVFSPPPTQQPVQQQAQQAADNAGDIPDIFRKNPIGSPPAAPQQQDAPPVFTQAPVNPPAPPAAPPPQAAAAAASAPETGNTGDPMAFFVKRSD